MARLLELDQHIGGDPPTVARRFAGDPQGWLPAPARWRGESAWTVALEAGPVTRTVVCRVGPTWSVGGERWRSLVWTPAPGRQDVLPVHRALPALTGELGLVEHEGDCSLLLRATYRPPAGALGRGLDALALHQLARHTAVRFLAAVGEALTATGARTPLDA